MKSSNSLRISILFILLNGILYSNQQEINSHKSTVNDTYYVAGVVEYQPNRKGDVNDNLKEYQKLIESNEAKEADIIVFPEATFNTNNTAVYVPNPKDNVTLCDISSNSTASNKTVLVEHDDPLRNISCIAKKVQKYILINVSEKENCTVESQKEANDTRPCANDGFNRYNTNVVFDRNGTIISRYRKWHLYVEPGVNTTVKPEYATFKTDFGVTFGHFICFDILFYTPTMELVKQGVKDFIFPTMWFSELPFLTAVQQQQSWAYSNDVNLLAAGASEPSVGSTGSGIYAGKQGALIKVMNSKPERKIYVVKVPKKNVTSSTSKSLLSLTTNVTGTSSDSIATTVNSSQQGYDQLKGLRLLRDVIDVYDNKFLNLTKLSANERICSKKGLCCNFDVSWNLVHNNNNSSSSKSYQYILAVHQGERTYQKTDKSFIRICALIACTNQTVSSCGTIFPDNVTVVNQFNFTKIQIEGEFISKINNDEILMMPTNLDETMYPLKTDEFEFTVMENGKNSQIVNCQLNSTSKSNLLTFGIYANYFKDEPNSSSKMIFNIFTMLISLVITLFYTRT